MVGSDYMTEHKSKPSAVKRFVDQQMMPAMIDAAGTLEAGLNRLGVAARGRPAVTLGTAAVVGAVLCRGLLMLARRRR